MRYIAILALMFVSSRCVAQNDYLGMTAAQQRGLYYSQPAYYWAPVYYAPVYPVYQPYGYDVGWELHRQNVILQQGVWDRQWDSIPYYGHR